MAARNIFTRNQIPTFTLVRVDPEKVLRDYTEGKYSSFKLPRSRSSDSSSVAIFNPGHDTDSSADIYAYRDKTGAESVLVSSGLHHSSKDIPQRCHYCRQVFEGTPVGVVIGRIVCYDGDGNMMITLYTDGIFNTFSCALAAIFENPTYYEKRYPRVISDTKGLYTLMHPKAPPLKAARDWRLLKANGGSLEVPAWSNNDYGYMAIPNINTIPYRTLHVRTDPASHKGVKRS